jgi:hypothetical protein
MIAVEKEAFARVERAVKFAKRGGGRGVPPPAARVDPFPVTFATETNETQAGAGEEGQGFCPGAASTTSEPLVSSGQHVALAASPREGETGRRMKNGVEATGQDTTTGGAKPSERGRGGLPSSRGARADM